MCSKEMCRNKLLTHGVIIIHTLLTRQIFGDFFQWSHSQHQHSRTVASEQETKACMGWDFIRKDISVSLKDWNKKKSNTFWQNLKECQFKRKSEMACFSYFLQHNFNFFLVCRKQWEEYCGGMTTTWNLDQTMVDDSDRSLEDQDYQSSQ